MGHDTILVTRPNCAHAESCLTQPVSDCLPLRTSRSACESWYRAGVMLHMLPFYLITVLVHSYTYQIENRNKKWWCQEFNQYYYVYNIHDVLLKLHWSVQWNLTLIWKHLILSCVLQSPGGGTNLRTFGAHRAMVHDVSPKCFGNNSVHHPAAFHRSESCCFSRSAERCWLTLGSAANECSCRIQGIHHR